MLSMGNHYRTRRHRQKSTPEPLQPRDVRGWPLFLIAAPAAVAAARARSALQQFLFDFRRSHALPGIAA